MRRTQRRNLFKKTFHKITFEVHPDKVNKAKISKEEANEATQRLNAAYETLNKWLEDNK